MGGGGRRPCRAAALGAGARVAAHYLRMERQLLPPPAVEARGDDLDRAGRLGAPPDATVRRAHLGDQGGPRRRAGAGAARRRPLRSVQPGPRAASQDCRGRDRGARARLRTRAYVFNTLLQDKAIKDRLRQYPHWLASRNLERGLRPVGAGARRGGQVPLRAGPPLVRDHQGGCSASTGSPTTTARRRSRATTRRSSGSRARSRCWPHSSRSPIAPGIAKRRSSADRRAPHPGAKGGAFSASTVPSVHPT